MAGSGAPLHDLVTLRLNEAETLFLDDDGRGPPAASAGARELGGPPGLDVLGPIGQGGMGEVLRVADRSLGRVLAMKVLRAELCGDSVAEERFLREAAATAALEHPGVVPVHALGRMPDGRPFFTMKEVRGETLEAVLRRPGPLRARIDLLLRVAEAVGYAHRKGVIHRDLKPGNVMVGEFGEVLVLDWGLVKVEARANGLLPEGRGHETLDGAVAGTPAFMAPEQAAGDIALLGPPTDVYALGVILYLMVAGRLPFEAPTTAALLGRILSGDPPPVPPGVDPGLWSICSQALAWEPSARFADGVAMADALRAWTQGATQRARALALVAEADAIDARRRSRVEEERALRAAGMAAEAALKPSQPLAQKAPVWALLERADALRADIEALERDWLRALWGALREAPHLPEADQRLADHHRAAHAAAEERGDRAQAQREELALRGHDAHQGRHIAYLAGKGRLCLFTDPAGARARLYRYQTRDRQQVLGPVIWEGRTPIDMALDMGSYLVEIAAPSGVPVRYPVLIERQQRWDARPPGGGDARVLRLPAQALEGFCFVPEGWTWTGVRGDRLDAELPARRVWLDSFWMATFPVTNADYIDFLDDLVRQGAEEQALRCAPRAGGEIIYGRRPDGGFCLVRDAEGDLWQPDWPVFCVDWSAAAAFAGWVGGRRGRAVRLPHELEWEKAGRGVDQRIFPWGDRFDPCFAWCRLSPEGAPHPASVSAAPLDASPYAVRGMSGGICEWCANPFESEGPALTPQGALAPWLGPLDGRLVAGRGGGWSSFPANCRLPFRRSWNPTLGQSHIGFRLLAPGP